MEVGLISNFVRSVLDDVGSGLVVELDEEHEGVESVVGTVDVFSLDENGGRSIIRDNEGITLVLRGLTINWMMLKRE